MTSQTFKRIYRFFKVIESGIKEGLFISGEPHTLAISVLAYINGLGAYAVMMAGGISMVRVRTRERRRERRARIRRTCCTRADRAVAR